MNIWLADLTHDQQVLAADTMPTNIAYLASYVQKESEWRHNIKLFKYPDKLIEAIEQAEKTGDVPDVVGFSNFMWNTNLAFAFTDEIRSRFKKVIIVFGGAELPN